MGAALSVALAYGPVCSSKKPRIGAFEERVL
jgi:hypothetical protein